MRACDIRPSDLETHAADRDGWRVLYKDGIKRAEYDRIDHLVTRRERRHIRAGRIQSHQPAQKTIHLLFLATQDSWTALVKGTVSL